MQTQRLTMRQFRKQDWRDMYEYLSDAEIVKYEPYAPLDAEMCRVEAARRATDADFIAVCLHENGKLIGNMYLHHCQYDSYEIGYVFNRAYQRQGYALEAARATVQYAFCELNAWRITAMCNPQNVRSWHVMQRLGMRREAHHIRDIYFERDAQGSPIWQDTYVYALLRDEYMRGVK